MVVSRFIVMAAAMLLIVASLGLGPPAAATTHDLLLHSSADSLNFDTCKNTGHHDLGCQSCCHGMSCVLSGVLAHVAIALPIMASISQPHPRVGIHLYGRSIAPETGPPKLPA